MIDAERERFRALIEGLDIRVATRPDILASPTGFILGALVGAGRSDPDDAFGQIAGLADLLAYIVVYVRAEGDATLDAILDALVPAGPDTLAGYLDSDPAPAIP